MLTALLIVVGVAAVAAAWGANHLWIRWEREYREKHGPPPGGNAIGYVAVIGAFVLTTVVMTNLLLWMG